MALNDRLQDEEIGRQADLLRYQNWLVARVIGLLNRVDADLFAALTVALERLPAGELNVQRLEELLGSVRRLNAQAYGAAGKELTKQLRDLVEIEAGFQLQLFEAEVPPQVLASVGVNAVSQAQVFAAVTARPFQGRLLREWAASLEESRMVRIRDAVRIGFVEQQTIDQIVRRIRGTKARGYADGLIEIDRRNAQAVVRTAVSHTAATTREQFYEANTDLIKARKWDATLDSRTTPTCFPESATVLPVGHLGDVTKRLFNGEMILVTTASGKQIKATPNHPVLTARGWRPIKELRPSNDVLYRVVSDIGGLSGPKNIEMPTTFGALFDAVSNPAGCNVFVESSSQADFHGDGMVGQNKVEVASADSDLGDGFDAVRGKQIAKDLLGFIQRGSDLPSKCLSDLFFDGLGFWNQPSGLDAMFSQDGVKAAFTYSKRDKDFGRLGSVLESCNDFPFIWPEHLSATRQSLHASGSFEDARDSGGGDSMGSTDGGGAGAIGIVADDVVSVSSELFSGHVYNLSSSARLYIADGFIVHNCQVRDGKLYEPVSHKPIGHSVPWLGGPGRAHWGCRSVDVPVTKSWRELGLDIDEAPASTRASMDGQVAAETTYGAWLQRQSARRQDDILGATRGALLRDGGLKFDELFNPRGQFLTLDQLRERRPGAFQ